MNSKAIKSSQWLSPAKLNLFLYITGRRADGYHNLQTLFTLINFGDYLTFTPRGDHKINLVTQFDGVTSSQNLIIKSANALIQYLKMHQKDAQKLVGFDIAIEKNIPMGAGLGGGSSNAATTLLALNSLLELNLSLDALIEIAKDLGADVPFFIFNHTAFAEGIGEKLSKITLPQKWYLLVYPDVKINTVSIFTDPNLKRNTTAKSLSVLMSEPFKNDCEPTVRSLYPIINELITFLSKNCPTRLTGTGSCLFSECENEHKALQLQALLHHTFPDLILKTIVTHSVNSIENRNKNGS